LILFPFRIKFSTFESRDLHQLSIYPSLKARILLDKMDADSLLPLSPTEVSPDEVYTQDFPLPSYPAQTPSPTPAVSPKPLSPLTEAKKWTWTVEFPPLPHDQRVKPDEHQLNIMSGAVQASECCNKCNDSITKVLRDLWHLLNTEWDLDKMPEDACDCANCRIYAKDNNSRTCWCGRCALRRLCLRGLLLKQQDFCDVPCKPYHTYLNQIFKFSEYKGE
jgi:hypothetical protein